MYALAIKVPDGALLPLSGDLDLSLIAEDFRLSTLLALNHKGTIRREFAGRVLCWDYHGGFSVDNAVKVPSE